MKSPISLARAVALMAVMLAAPAVAQAGCPTGVNDRWWSATHYNLNQCYYQSSNQVTHFAATVLFNDGSQITKDPGSSSSNTYALYLCISSTQIRCYGTLFWESAAVSYQGAQNGTRTRQVASMYDANYNTSNSSCYRDTYVDRDEVFDSYCKAEQASTESVCEASNYYWDSVGGPGAGGWCIDEDACEAQGLFFSFLPGDSETEVCRDLLGLGDSPCPDPAPTFYCGEIIPAMNGECMYTYVTDAICFSPVLIDVAGDGLRLSSAARGVLFDIDGNPDNVKEAVSWVDSADDAWLVFDRNHNGVIDSGRELFGNATPQQTEDKRGGEANGFNALATFDTELLAGNGDGVVDAKDGFWRYLRLWQDANRDGVSQPGELHTLESLDISRLHFDDKESKRVDEHGNEFRYKAKVDDAKGARAGRWAYDVYLKAAQ